MQVEESFADLRVVYGGVETAEDGTDAGIGCVGFGGEGGEGVVFGILFGRRMQKVRNSP